MESKLKMLVSMLARGISGFALLGLLLFGCAGSLRYWNAWLLTAAFAALMLMMGLVLLIKSPETLQRRLKSKETESEQKTYMGIIAAIFLISFILAGLDYRFGWSNTPVAVPVVALVVLVVGYSMYAVVILQNAYASRVVEVQEGQAVISTGLYSVVRHPMYLSSMLIFMAMPLVLGSYISLIPMLGFPAMLVLRIKNEEKVLISGLPGYAEYMEKVRYRLIPFIW